MSLDEVTTINCQRLIVVRMYVVEDWKHIHILLTLEQVLFGAIANNLTKVIVGSVLQYGGLFETNLVSKLISFGANGALFCPLNQSCCSNVLQVVASIQD